MTGKFLSATFSPLFVSLVSFCLSNCLSFVFALLFQIGSLSVFFSPLTCFDVDLSILPSFCLSVRSLDKYSFSFFICSKVSTFLCLRQASTPVSCIRVFVHLLSASRRLLVSSRFSFYFLLYNPTDPGAAVETAKTHFHKFCFNDFEFEVEK